jgi:hypothetical protein
MRMDQGLKSGPEFAEVNYEHCTEKQIIFLYFVKYSLYRKIKVTDHN